MAAKGTQLAKVVTAQWGTAQVSAHSFFSYVAFSLMFVYCIDLALKKSTHEEGFVQAFLIRGIS